MKPKKQVLLAIVPEPDFVATKLRLIGDGYRSSITPTGFYNEDQGQRRSRATLGTLLI